MHLLFQRNIGGKSRLDRKIGGAAGLLKWRTKVNSLRKKSLRKRNFYGEGGHPENPPAFAKASARHGIRRAESLQHHEALRIYVGKRGTHAIFRHGNVIGHVVLRLVAI